MPKVIGIILLLVLFVSPLSILGQTTSTQQGEEKVVTGTTEVIFDAVVKDKKGRPVKDLKAQDFQITEDGVPQEVKSFRLVAGDAPDSAATDKPGKSAGGPKATARILEAFNAGRIGTVALVFDRLSSDSRTRAHDAALTYLGSGLGQSDFVGVFGIDLKLTVFQTFTNDDKLIRPAIDKVGLSASSPGVGSQSQITEMLERNTSLTEQLSQAEANAAASQSMGNVASLALDKALNGVSLRAAQGFERMEQTEKGQATTDGLLAIVAAMGGLPGRKAIIFFSEGVSIPTAVSANFRTVISNANRANVSIYAVDAVGLRAKSADVESGRAMTALGQQRAAQAGSSGDDFSSMMRDSERNEELVRNNPEGVMGQLASETGGLLVSGTNNPGPRLRQVNDDLHSYYVLTYTPKNPDYDGKLRQIGVKVNRFEARALAVLSGKSQANAFATKASDFSFPEANKPGLVPVVVELPTKTVNFVSDTEKKTYRTDFAVVVVIKDEFQHPVRKLSSQYLLSGPLDQIETAKRGNILFYRETDLEPGQYTMDSIAYDATNNQSSVSHHPLTVPDSDQTKLRISNLVVVAQAQKVSTTDSQTNPFRVGELMLIPNLGEPLHKAGSKGLTIFVTSYPAKNSTAAPKMTIELYMGGSPAGQLPVQLPAQDQNGRIQYTGTIPIDAFPPGEYELKAMVTDGVTKTTRSERFTVQP